MEPAAYLIYGAHQPHAISGFPSKKGDLLKGKHVRVERSILILAVCRKNVIWDVLSSGSTPWGFMEVIVSAALMTRLVETTAWGLGGREGRGEGAQISPK